MKKVIARAQEKYTYIDRLRAQQYHTAYPEDTLNTRVMVGRAVARPFFVWYPGQAHEAQSQG